MVLKILQIGDDRLLKKSRVIKNFDDESLQKLIDDMIDTCEAGKEHTAGLAAPQVGENVRLTVIRRVDLEEMAVYTNPAVNGGETEEDTKPDHGAVDDVDSHSSTESSSNYVTDTEVQKPLSGRDLWEPLLNPRVIAEDEIHDTIIWEACLSIGTGPKQLYGPVARSAWVTVEYEDRSGQTKTIRGEGFLSHLLQHEIDHLDGILFTTRVPKPHENLWLSRDLDDYLEKYGDYPKVDLSTS